MRDPVGFARVVEVESKSRPYLVTLPATDAAMRALDHPALPLMGKIAIGARAREAGLAVPPSQIFESRAALVRSAAQLPYPVVVKPDYKRFSAQYAARPEDLARIPTTDGALVVQPFIPEAMRGVVGLMWQGRLVNAVHVRYLRIWPYPCGSMAAGTTQAPDLALEAGLERLLAGYDGLFHADIAGPYLLDLNLRIHPLLALASAAGIDLLPMYCQLLLGEQVPTLQPRAGLFFRWIEGDMRSVSQAVMTRRSSWRGAAQALRPRRGTVHGYETLDDPGPAFARLALAPRQFRDRRARQRDLAERVRRRKSMPEED